MNKYYVYIITNKFNTVLYTGMTNNLQRRMNEHMYKVNNGFTKLYNISKLVFYEETNDVKKAIAREKQIKGWTRVKKVALIESVNPQWKDLRNVEASENLTLGDSSLRSE